MIKWRLDLVVKKRGRGREKEENQLDVVRRFLVSVVHRTESGRFERFKWFKLDYPSERIAVQAKQSGK